MSNTNNPLLCDPEKGACEIPVTQGDTGHFKVRVSQKPIKVIYFTDPICSSCWGIEPELRKLKLEYGTGIEVEYHMGGLLPDWSYNSGGISKPSDVAHHWDEVSLYYEMPIDGDVWLEDPLSSSYPPSIAFKAAQMQDNDKAILFLRRMREMVFLEKKNITKWEYISQAAITAGLDVPQLKKDYEGAANELFLKDLEMAKKLGVRGFPSLYFTDAAGNSEFVYGVKPYSTYENAVKKLQPVTGKEQYDKSWESLFTHYSTLTTKEFGVLSGTSKQETEQLLEGLVVQHKLTKQVTKNGVLWKAADTVR
ncbi:MAG: ClpXP adapter SpxH family protein [Bacteroidota bacterium]